MTANLFVLYLKFHMHFIRNDMMLLLGVLHLSVLRDTVNIEIIVLQTLRFPLDGSISHYV